jgi:hypothetical protein
MKSVADPSKEFKGESGPSLNISLPYSTFVVLNHQMLHLFVAYTEQIAHSATFHAFLSPIANIFAPKCVITATSASRSMQLVGR